MNSRIARRLLITCCNASSPWLSAVWLTAVSNTLTHFSCHRQSEINYSRVEGYKTPFPKVALSAIKSIAMLFGVSHGIASELRLPVVVATVWKVSWTIEAAISENALKDSTAWELRETGAIKSLGVLRDWIIGIRCYTTLKSPKGCHRRRHQCPLSPCVVGTWISTRQSILYVIVTIVVSTITNEAALDRVAKRSHWASWSHCSEENLTYLRDGCHDYMGPLIVLVIICLRNWTSTMSRWITIGRESETFMGHVRMKKYNRFRNDYRINSHFWKRK